MFLSLFINSFVILLRFMIILFIFCVSILTCLFSADKKWGEIGDDNGEENEDDNSEEEDNNSEEGEDDNMEEHEDDWEETEDVTGINGCCALTKVVATAVSMLRFTTFALHRSVDPNGTSKVGAISLWTSEEEDEADKGANASAWRSDGSSAKRNKWRIKIV